MSNVEPLALHQLDYDLADVVAADTPARLRAVADPFRVLVLDLVLEQAMSVTELAERTGRPKGTVAHHVEVLHDAGLLQVVRTRKVRAMEERFYGRTARTISFPDSVHDGDLPFLADARALADTSDAAAGLPTGFTLRSVRIPDDRAEAFCERVMELALEFSRQPRGGTREYALLVGFFPTNRPVAPKLAEPKEVAP